MGPNAISLFEAACKNPKTLSNQPRTQSLDLDAALRANASILIGQQIELLLFSAIWTRSMVRDLVLDTVSHCWRRSYFATINHSTNYSELYGIFHFYNSPNCYAALNICEFKHPDYETHSAR